jgi:hypothetical protein
MSDPHGIIGIYRKGGGMKTIDKPYTIDELITNIYEDNYSHIEFMENMNGGDCDCNIHNAMNLIEEYM